MGTSETLRSVLEAGSTSKRLDELSTARVIGQTALKVHAEQQKAGPGKAVGPITPGAVGIGKSGDISLALGKQESALGYSAPESLGGASDRRSDVFSLGVLMWEALTHQRLFEAMNDAAVKAAIKERDITPPAELNANIPAELSAICMKALARNPADRYQSTKVMAVEIEEMLSEAGYPDNDERVAAYIADLPKHREVAKPKLPAPHVAKPVTPPMAIPKVTSSTSPPPSVLTTPASPLPAISPAMTMLGTAPAPAAPIPTALGSAPMPPTLPRPPIIAGAPPPIPVAEPMPSAATAAAGANAEPAQLTLTPPPGMTVTPLSAPAPREAPPFVPKSHGTNGSGASDTLPASAAANPADVVSLPSPRRDPTDTGRKSQELLGTWGWQTDSVTAIADDDDYAPPPSSRKTLVLLIGGGLVLALVVTVIAVGFRGSSKKDEPAAAAKPASTEVVAKTDPAPQGSATEGSNVAGVVAGSNAETGSGAGSSAVASAGSSAAPETGSSAGPETGSSAGSAAGSSTGSADVAVAATDPTKSEVGSAKTATKPEVVETKPAPTDPKTDPKVDTKTDPKPTKLEPKPPVEIKKPPVEIKKPPVETKKPPVEIKKPDKIAKVEPKPEPKPDKTTKVAKPPKPDKVAKVEPKPDTKTVKATAAKSEVEAAYRTGIQQFARGDTSGALTSLRTSLAGNPNYPPTWRGLGLVFEKMGEKDQAKAAFRRYLQLSPGAGDADQIRSRLERLGS